MNISKWQTEELPLFSHSEQSTLNWFLTNSSLLDDMSVQVCFSRELSEPCWAVHFNDFNHEFWLNSFPTKDEALDYCNKYNFKIANASALFAAHAALNDEVSK